MATSNFKIPQTGARLIVIAVATALLLTIAGLKAGMLQLNRGKALLSLSHQQYLRASKYEGMRGDILDRNGHILSTSVVVSSIFAEPRRMSDPDHVAAKLAEYLPKEQKSLEERLNSNRSFVWILRRAEPNIVNQIMAAELEGIKIVKEPRRFYPNHALLGQVLGLVSIDQKASGGIERAFTRELEPKSWRSLSYIDAKGDAIRPFLAPNPRELNGADIVLTIDRDLQYAAEEALLKTVSEHRAKGGWAIVMNPKSGEILALANVPLFNPNRPSASQKNAMRNQAISRTGEPGSTFKMVTFAAALENKVVTPDDVIDCENGKYDPGFMIISDVVKKEKLTVTEVFKYSSNVGTYKIAEKVGPERLYKTIRNFGFGDTPGLGLIEEAKGSVSTPDTWAKTRFANISFGYGLMASSLQLLMVASAIANDGILVTPKIIASAEVNPPRRALSEVAARQVKAMMLADTADGGTGKRARINGVEVAGKTGTAEKVDPETGRYAKEHNLSSFVGFAPVDSPEIVAIVVIDEPQGIAYGGYVAAPAWQRIVSAALIRLGIVQGSNKDKGSIHEARTVARGKRPEGVAEKLCTVRSRKC